MLKKSHSASLLVSLACVLTLVGCADTDEADQPLDGQGSKNSNISTPAFQGPWSDWFTQIFRSDDTTDLQREILADGVISDTEYAEVRNSFKQCLEDLGVSVKLEPDGGFAVQADGNLNESQVTADAVPGCEKKTVGSVAMLYEQIRRNPDRKDESLIVVDCLKRNKVVGDAYTVAQYNKDIESQTGLEWTSLDVRRCSQDPLGVLNMP